MRILSKNVDGKLSVVIRLLAFLGLSGGGLWIFFRLGELKSGGLGGGVAASILFLFGTVLIAAGLLAVAWPLLTRGMAAMVNGLFLPSAKLEKPALMLSPVAGKIAAGQLEEALRELKELERLHPENAAVCRMAADLYAGRLHDPQSAFETLRRYLHGSDRTPVEECVPLVMRYTDLCLRGGLYDEARMCVERELRRTCYSERERARLRKRLDVIGRRQRA